MGSRPLFALALAALLAGGCEPAVQVENVSPFDQDDPAAQPATPDAPAVEGEGAADRREPAPAEKAPEPAPTRTTIERATLDRVLAGGLGAFLAGVEVAPRLDLHQRFSGWEIVRYDYGGVDLRPGDVVESINGHPLERPKQVEALWESLQRAGAIEVHGERDGQPLLLRVEVIGAPTSVPDRPQAAATP